MSQQQECTICWFVCPQLAIRQCDLCKGVYHELCYFQSRSRKEVNCEACAHVMQQNLGKKKKIQPFCFICNKNDNVLKQIEGDRFVHVLCALTSNNIKLQTYQQFKIEQKPISKQQSCQQCHRKSSHLVSCQLCDYKVHKQCLPSEQLYVGQDLQGNLKYTNNILQFLYSQKYQHQQLSLIFSCKPQWKYQQSQFKKLAVCYGEFKKYSWCFCGNSSINDQETNESVLCDGCNRYCHLSCTGMKNPQQNQSYFCPGCKSGQKYKKLARLPDLIKSATLLQQKKKLEIEDIRQIDAFPYIYSEKLKRNLREHIEMLVQYLAIKAVQQLCNNNSKKQNEDGQKICKLLLFLMGQNSQYSSSSTGQQLWNGFLQYIRKYDKLSLPYFQANKPCQMEKKNDVAKVDVHEQKVRLYLQKFENLMADPSKTKNQLAMIQYIRVIRQNVRSSNKIRQLVEKNMQSNVLLAMFVFKCSSMHEQRMIQTLLAHFISEDKITHKTLEQLRVLKKKGCPNFQVDHAWSQIQKYIQISEQSSDKQMEQSKVEIKSYHQHEPIVAKILQSRQLNPKIFIPLKKRVQSMTKFGQYERKIKLCYQWSLLSKKIYFGLQKKRISICGVLQCHKIMKRCQYPQNQMKKRLQKIYNDAKPIAKALKRIQSLSKIQKKPQLLQLQQYILKPSISDLERLVKGIQECKHAELWGQLQKQQLKIQIQKAMKIKQKASIIMQQTFNNECMQQSSTITPEQKQNSQKILQLKNQILQSSVLILNPHQFYQLLHICNNAEIVLKNTKWIDQKKAQQKNEKQLIQSVNAIISQLKLKLNHDQFADYSFQNIIYDEKFESIVGDMLSARDRVKMEYLSKHVKRNKKWVSDLRGLESGLLRHINYEEICSLECKVQSSIFDHTKLIQKIITPLKAKCEQFKKQLQQIAPYGTKIAFQMVRQQNVYSPQNRLFIKLSQLRVKDFSIRIYQKDCQSLKNLINFQKTMDRKLKQNLLAQFESFQKIYKDISPYLHEYAFVWERILQIGEKLVMALKELKAQYQEREIQFLNKKAKKIIKVIKYMAEIGNCPTNIAKLQQIQGLLNRQEERLSFADNDSC